MRLRATIALSLLALAAGGCRSAHGPAAPPVASLAGGSFKMGTSADALQRFRSSFPHLSDRIFEAELSERTVTVPPFRIDRYEVTNDAFMRFVDANPEWSPREKSPETNAQHPVVNVTWHAAQAYCGWRGGRLPTEAEWEYAARGGREGKLYPWGDEHPDPSRANYSGSGFGSSTPVGSYPSNGYGLFDMSGNVWEWTGSPWTPDGSSAGADARYAIRGGSWGGAAVNLRVAYRDSHRAADARDFIGFRCVYVSRTQ